ncbi:MAG TPA: Rrf2 family transcriptional regulator [Chroococcales cyanobacterium]|jgi:Rrf2 family iron-sulfur cluster assembly transcriptional regulator
MRLTNKGKYGINALLVLASSQEEGPLSLKAIAGKAGIPEHYLEQIMGRLRQSGLVASTRGVQGGYRLARESEKIFIGEIVEAAEDSVQPVKCASHQCERSDSCLNHDLWSRVTESMLKTLNGMSLAALCRDAFDHPCRGEDCSYPAWENIESGGV